MKINNNSDIYKNNLFCIVFMCFLCFTVVTTNYTQFIFVITVILFFMGEQFPIKRLFM